MKLSAGVYSWRARGPWLSPWHLQSKVLRWKVIRMAAAQGGDPGEPLPGRVDNAGPRCAEEASNKRSGFIAQQQSAGPSSDSVTG